MMTPSDKHDVLKLGASWAAVGVSGWDDISKLLASILTGLLICDFFWKRFFRKYAERRWPRYFPRRRRRSSDFIDSTDHAPLDKE